MKCFFQNDKGFSLIEVMIALIITGVVTTSIMKLYITQHENYMTQDDITTIQQNARASIDELSRQIRMAGYDLPLGLQAIYASNTDPDTITILYHSAGCETSLTAPMANTLSPLVCNSDVSCFFDNQHVYIYDADSAEGEWFQLSTVDEGTFTLNHSTASLSRAYATNSIVIALTKVKFYVDNTTDVDHPKLMIQVQGQNPVIYADDIYDLQIEYGMKNGMIESVPSIPENVREVNITLASRSFKPVLDDSGVETYRERSFSTSVYLRNIGI